MTVGDAIFTTLGVKDGIIAEANPLLAAFFNASPELTAIITAIGVTALLYIIYRCRNRIRWINTALIGLFVVKLAVLGLHFNWIAQII